MNRTRVRAPGSQVPPGVLSIDSLQGGFPGGTLVKNPLASAGDTEDTGSIPGLGRPPGVGNGSPLQYSCLENPIDNGARPATVHGVAKSGHDLVSTCVLCKELNSTPDHQGYKHE